MNHTKHEHSGSEQGAIPPCFTMEEPVRAALERLFGDRRVLASLPDVVSVLDRNMCILYMDASTFGQDASSVLGTDALRHLKPQSQSRFREAFERAWNEEKLQSVEITSTSGRWWEVRLVPVKDDGSVLFMLCSTRDITDRQEAREKLHESESRFRLALAASRMGSWTWDAKDNTVGWDENLCAIVGIRPQDAPRSIQAVINHIHPDDRAKALASARLLTSTGEHFEDEFRFIRSNGEVRHVLSVGTAIRSEAGELLGTRCIAMDITDRKRMEEQLQQAQKMQAIGQLTAGIAHNFNNALGIILPNIALCEMHANDETRARLHDIRDAAERAAEMVRQLMFFSRPESGAPKVPLDLSATVLRIIEMCRATFDRRIAIELQTDPSLPQVPGNEAQLEQALLNICLNARDALTRTASPHPRILITLRALEPQRVAITVSDNGAGMEEATRLRVFEPFFTTKAIGSGTGLGLASVYAIVTDHGGSISCESTVGAGTTFTVVLPAIPNAVVTATTETVAPASQQGGETILLVDDEPALRRALRGLLESTGYHILEAGDGDEGLAVYQRHAHEIHLIVLDRSMPRMSGDEVLDALIELRATVKVIMLSGDPGAGASRSRVSAVLTKPSDPRELLSTVRRVLDEQTTQPH